MLRRQESMKKWGLALIAVGLLVLPAAAHDDQHHPDSTETLLKSCAAMAGDMAVSATIPPEFEGTADFTVPASPDASQDGTCTR